MPTKQGIIFDIYPAVIPQVIVELENGLEGLQALVLKDEAVIRHRDWSAVERGDP
ncbi:hypothetical protein [Pedobacter yonginense]|uniref:hypothetical protein n=1 Tax=Pedobacter yonginense TaxID=651869 RepID=UPI0014033690|nr:hypothetical protein [Pedobacter yonginense]